MAFECHFLIEAHVARDHVLKVRGTVVSDMEPHVSRDLLSMVLL